MLVTPKRFAGMKRFEHILSVLSRHGLGYALEKMHLKKRTLFSRRKISRPVEVRMLFEELGGSFIKLGQLLSMRPDLIPKDYCDELSKLLDSFEPIPFAEVEHIIRSELKKPIKSIFKSFDQKPVASASIGQVHVARLKNGKKVAVKVMRPGIKSLYESDLEIMDYLARHLKHHYNPGLFDPEEIFAEFKRYTESELDYLKETHNIKVFGSHNQKDKKVFLPTVYDSLTTSRVLTMSFVEGIELNKVLIAPGSYKSINRKRVAEQLLSSFMKQVFIDGLFHADPHPGNILFSKGKIGFLDFGVIGRLDDEMKRKMGSLFIGLIEGDAAAVTKAMISLDLSSSEIDVASLRADITDALGEYYDTSLEKIDVAELFFKAIGLARKYHIRISRDYVLLGKALATLKTVCMQLDHDFNFVKEARPFIAKIVAQKASPDYLIKRLAAEAERFSEFVQELPDNTKKISHTIDRADIALQDINQDMRYLTTEVRREGGRLIIGIIIAALLISASLVRATDIKAAYFFVGMAALLAAYIILSMLHDLFRKKK
jgi:ubiquinone biosynthesis protein